MRILTSWAIKKNFKTFKTLKHSASNTWLYLCKVCTELGLRFGRCEEDSKAILKEQIVTKPSKELLEKDWDTVEEEHHMILFLSKANK